MTERHPIPDFRTVVSEQVRVVGLAVRREALVLVGVLCLIGLLILIDVWSDGRSLDAFPVPPVAMIALGALAPFAVWKGERVFDGAHLWTLPVERRGHALIKVLAGGFWVLVAVAGVQLWILAVVLASGGDLVTTETRMLVGPGGLADLTPVRWTTQAWEWLTPFTTAAVCYLIGSAFMLGVKHPLRWGMAAVGAFVALGVMAEEIFPGGLPELIFDTVTESRLGIGPALGTGVADEVESIGPEVTVFWYRLPSFERWAPAVLFWSGLSSALVWLAASRHRES